MIKIPCSILEQVRRNPSAHAQFLATGDKPKTGGSRGMFAYFKDVVKLVHTKEFTVSEGIKELENKFARFDDTLKNKNKQNKLFDDFVEYCNAYNKMGFEFADTKHQIKWDLLPTVRLTGHTPWVVYDDSYYYAYFIVEQSFDWQSELRFPLIQSYLSNNTIECKESEMKVGIYSLDTNSFDLKSFSSKELKGVITETTNIFQNVIDEYNKIKK